MIDFASLAGANTGAIGDQEVAALQKALDSGGYGTDMSQLTGGAALRIQSLDTTMQATIQENSDFALFNALPKPKAGATVDEWTEQNGIGGFLGGSTNSESGAISGATGSYARRVGLVKFLMTQRQVTLVSTINNNIADVEALEYRNGALQLLSDAEYLMFNGDSSVVPTEFDGIEAQMRAGIAAGLVDGGHCQDLRGGPLNGITPSANAARIVRSIGNFGRITDLFCSTAVQTDLDVSLDPAYRVPLNDVPNGGITLGSPVSGMRTSFGNIKMRPDIFVIDQDQQVPFEIGFPAQAAAQAGLTPVSVTVTVATNAASLFTAPQAGNYYWRVCGVNAAGQSVTIATAQTAVAAGQAATLTIAGSAGATETGYVIYRSRLNGTNAVADVRYQIRVPRTGATTVWIDTNYEVPGTTDGFYLNLTPGATAILWRQLLPMLKFALYPTNAAVIPWAQLLFGYLRISKRRHVVWVKNILPTTYTWRPFGV